MYADLIDTIGFVGQFDSELAGVAVSGALRMACDSVVWVSLSKVVEVGRLRLTPDSVVIHIKILNSYFRGTYNTVSPVITGNSEEKYSLLDGNSENHAVTVGTLNVYTLAYKPAINPGVGFYKFVGSSIPARKAYLQTSTLEDAGITLGAKGLQFSEIVDEEEFYEDPTAVSGVKEDTDDVDAVFDLSGKPVDPDQMRKGMIYIIGGQKQLYE